MDDLKPQICELIVTTLKLDVEPEKIDPGAPLFGEESALGLDSLDALDLVVELEYRFGVKLELEGERAREVFRSVASLAAYVQEQKQQPR